MDVAGVELGVYLSTDLDYIQRGDGRVSETLMAGSVYATLAEPTICTYTCQQSTECASSIELPRVQLDRGLLGLGGRGGFVELSLGLGRQLLCVVLDGIGRV